MHEVLDGHEKGVYSLAYSPEYNLLVSAGFDRQAMVWNPYMGNLICTLEVRIGREKKTDV